MKVGLVQHACSDDYNDNFAASIRGIRTAAGRGARLIVLQELHTYPYFCMTEDVAHFNRAETIPGPTTKRLCDIARRLQVVLVGSVFEQRAPGLYHNTAVIISNDGSLAGIYRKMHVPDDPGYYEKFYFAPGDLGFHPVTTPLGRLGIMICWDQWFPEAARLMALAGAELLIYPSAIGWDPREDPQEQQRQKEAWQIVQRGHAIANGLPLICCNRVGMEAATSSSFPGIQFWGSSFICGPQGELIVEASPDHEAVLVTEIHRDNTEQIRQAWPLLRDRRIDAYDAIGSRYLDSSD